MQRTGKKSQIMDIIIIIGDGPCPTRRAGAAMVAMTGET